VGAVKSFIRKAFYNNNPYFLYIFLLEDVLDHNILSLQMHKKISSRHYVVALLYVIFVLPLTWFMFDFLTSQLLQVCDLIG